MRNSNFRRSLFLGPLVAFLACSEASETMMTVDAAADVVSGDDLRPDLDVPEDVPPEAPDIQDELDTADAIDETPSGTDESRARAFKLFYRERLDRVLVAFNRFSLFGDVGFAVAVDRADVARDGDSYDIVVGPKDNNLMGTPLRAIWHAWRHFRSRTAELTLIRMLRGFEFYESVSGVPGLTSRMVLTGWTLDIDGVTKTAKRTRGGAMVASPMPTDAALEAEIIETFFDGLSVKVRSDPKDTYLSFLPGRDPVDYAITHSIPNLPDFIRISDCCATLRRTPEGKPWENAWWSNHNSRDNFPDIALGFLAAREALTFDETPADVKAIAQRVVDAGTRVADLTEANGGNIMTIDEVHPYGELSVSGELRPHGLPENEDLGSMASCPMALLNRALTKEGLTSEPKDVFLPGTQELLIQRDFPGLIACEFETPRRCKSIGDAICDLPWARLDELTVFDQADRIFDRFRQPDPATSGARKSDDKSIAVSRGKSCRQLDTHLGRGVRGDAERAVLDGVRVCGGVALQALRWCASLDEAGHEARARFDFARLEFLTDALTIARAPRFQAWESGRVSARCGARPQCVAERVRQGARVLDSGVVAEVRGGRDFVRRGVGGGRAGRVVRTAGGGYGEDREEGRQREAWRRLHGRELYSRNT